MAKRPTWQEIERLRTSNKRLTTELTKYVEVIVLALESGPKCKDEKFLRQYIIDCLEARDIDVRVLRYFLNEQGSDL